MRMKRAVLALALLLAVPFWLAPLGWAESIMTESTFLPVVLNGLPRSVTPIATASSTATLTPSATPTHTPTLTPSATATLTPTLTPTDMPTPVPHPDITVTLFRKDSGANPVAAKVYVSAGAVPVVGAVVTVRIGSQTFALADLGNGYYANCAAGSIGGSTPPAASFEATYQGRTGTTSWVGGAKNPSGSCP